MTRHAEIAGAGFAGLAAAMALLERGWSVRVHERAPSLRSEGFGIALQENGWRVLRAFGLQSLVEKQAVRITRRIICNARGDAIADLGISAQQVRISRSRVIDAMASRIATLGGEIVTHSEAIGADMPARLILSCGAGLPADVIIAADGVNSRIRDAVGLKPKVRLLADGAMRLVIPRLPSEYPPEGSNFGVTCENWSGRRRLIYSPCSSDELYVAMSCLASDRSGRQVPLDRPSWQASFPHLAWLFDRIEQHADWATVKWDRFRIISLRHWSSGNVAVVGDAAHAMPPNLAQGGCCAMMNGLSLAASLSEAKSVRDALEEWEARERPLIEHTQRWSRLYGIVTSWPDFARSATFWLVELSPWLREQLQRAARHQPYGS